jgi:hypothetical protein
MRFIEPVALIVVTALAALFVTWSETGSRWAAFGATLLVLAAGCMWMRAWSWLVHRRSAPMADYKRTRDALRRSTGWAS